MSSGQYHGTFLILKTPVIYTETFKKKKSFERLEPVNWIVKTQKTGYFPPILWRESSNIYNVFFCQFSYCITDVRILKCISNQKRVEIKDYTCYIYDGWSSLTKLLFTIFARLIIPEQSVYSQTNNNQKEQVPSSRVFIKL